MFSKIDKMIDIGLIGLINELIIEQIQKLRNSESITNNQDNQDNTDDQNNVLSEKQIFKLNEKVDGLTHEIERLSKFLHEQFENDKYTFKKWREEEAKKKVKECVNDDSDTNIDANIDRDKKGKRNKKSRRGKRSRRGRSIRKLLPSAKTAGRVAGAVGAGLAIVDGVLQYQDTQNTAEREQVVSKTVGSAGGAWAGAEAGGTLGATIGAGIGSAVPIVGTAVGAGVGAVIGAVGGAWAGSEIGSKIGSWIGSFFKDVEDTIPDSIRKQGVLVEIYYIDHTFLPTITNEKDRADLLEYRAKLVARVKEQLKSDFTKCSQCHNDEDRANFIFRYYQNLTMRDNRLYRLIAENLAMLVSIKILNKVAPLGTFVPNKWDNQTMDNTNTNPNFGQTSIANSSFNFSPNGKIVSASTPVVPNADVYKSVTYEIETGHKYGDSKGYSVHDKGSSYYGGFQFSESTSKEYLTKLGKTWQDYLKDPQVQEQVFQMETERNKRIMESKNIPITNTTLWMAHNIGIGGVQNVFSGKPISSTTLKNIRNQKGMNSSSTVDDYIAYYAKLFGEPFKKLSDIKNYNSNVSTTYKSAHTGAITASVPSTSSRTAHTGAITATISPTSSRTAHTGKPIKTPEANENVSVTQSHGKTNSKFRGKTYQLAQVKPVHMNRLERLNAEFGGRDGLFIVSGYRSPEYNRKVGGAKNSYHMKGLATDISIIGWDSSKITKFLVRARELGCKGFGYYGSSHFIHIDSRPTKDPVVWNKSTTPKIYLDAIYNTQNKDQTPVGIMSSSPTMVSNATQPQTFDDLEDALNTAYHAYDGKHLLTDIGFSESNETTSDTTHRINNTLKQLEKKQKQNESKNQAIAPEQQPVVIQAIAPEQQPIIPTTSLDLAKRS